MNVDVRELRNTEALAFHLTGYCSTVEFVDYVQQTRVPAHGFLS